MEQPPTLTTCTLDCPDCCSVVCSFEPGDSPAAHAGGAAAVRAGCDPGGLAGGGPRLRLRGNPEHPYTRGFTCAKIRRYPARLASPERIVQPQLRRGDRFLPVSWDDAFAAIVPPLTEALRTDPATVLFLRRSGSTGISKSYADYLFGGLGARTTVGGLCEAAGGAAIKEDAGALRMNPPGQIDRADAIVLWGKHPRACSIHVAALVLEARRRGVPVLAVNPDTAAVAGIADRVIRLRPGTDRFLALAVVKILLGTSRRPPPWEEATNASAFQALLAEHPLAKLLQASDTTEDEARALAAVYAATPRVATVVGWGLQRYLAGGENVRALHALAFLAGTLTVAGGGLYYDVSGSRNLRKPEPPKWRPDPPPAGGGGAESADLPPRQSPPPLRPPPLRPPPLQLALLGQELAAADPPVRFLWVMCGNPVNQIPDSAAVSRAFALVPARVVVDGYWTDTAQAATLILPPKLWLEEEDVAASFWHQWLGFSREVIKPPAGCRSDFEILQELGRRLGFATEYPTLDSWLSARLPEGRSTLDRVRAEGFVAMPEPEVAWSAGFAHPDGRFRLLEQLTPEPPPDPERPLHLLSMVRREAMHSQMFPREQEKILSARIHPETADALGLEDGGEADVRSEAGGLLVRLQFDAGLHPEALACPRDSWVSLGVGPNIAHTAAVADLGGQAAYYSTRVAVARRAAGGAPKET